MGVIRVFLFLFTVYLVIKRKESFFLLKPLNPKRLKDTIVKLGASFIKLAQVLATRSDFFNEEYLEQLRNLHDQIPPMDKKSLKEVYEISFDKKDIFKDFDNEPIASASNCFGFHWTSSYCTFKRW